MKFVNLVSKVYIKNNERLIGIWSSGDSCYF